MAASRELLAQLARQAIAKIKISRRGQKQTSTFRPLDEVQKTVCAINATRSSVRVRKRP
jgi:hypothetical protein